MKILVGEKYGEWLVLGRVGKIVPERYTCRCGCGIEKEVFGSVLRAIQRHPMCRGCAAKKRSKISEIELIGKVFSSWTVLGRDKRNDGNHIAFYICECKCGVKKAISLYKLRKGLTLMCSLCSVARLNRCQVCGCSGHKNIDLETSECDHIGVCPQCDKFNMKDWLANLVAC